MEVLPSAGMLLVYSTAPADWALLGESYPSEEMLSVYSSAPADWTTGHSLGVLQGR